MRKSAHGYAESAGSLKIACRFDPHTFRKIKAMAAKEGKSFSAMASTLCKVGLLDLEESDALEPKDTTHV
jgi:hypothetical protein